jgi:hypothetical protein
MPRVIKIGGVAGVCPPQRGVPEAGANRRGLRLHGGFVPAGGRGETSPPLYLTFLEETIKRKMYGTGWFGFAFAS